MTASLPNPFESPAEQPRDTSVDAGVEEPALTVPRAPRAKSATPRATGSSPAGKAKAARRPAKPRSARAAPAKPVAATDPGPPPPLPTDVSTHADLVIPPRPPLPPIPALPADLAPPRESAPIVESVVEPVDLPPVSEPVVEPAPTSNVEPAPTSDSELEPMPEATVDAESPIADAAVGPEPIPEAIEVDPEPIPEPISEPTVGQESILEAPVGPEPISESEPTPDAEPVGLVQPEPVLQPETLVEAQLDAPVESAPRSLVEPQTEPEPTRQPEPEPTRQPAALDAQERHESTDELDSSASVVIVDRDDESQSDAPVPVLALRGVTKLFGDTRAVDAIDLTVPAGSFYGLVGPNGAGKTTTLSMIAGLLRPDAGTISIGGIDASRKGSDAKRLMGVLPDRLRTFDRLTGRQLLYYYGVLRGLPAAVVEARTADLARAFDLTGALGRSVSDYSAGMTKKVMLAGAMIHSPRLLVLDEPFEAVDPVSSAVILDILGTYVAHGGTVILSSHGMELVERVCSGVAVIVAGQILAEGTVDEVRGASSLEQRFLELAGGLGDREGLEWLHTFSD